MLYEIFQVRNNDCFSWGVVDTDTGEVDLFADLQEACDACYELNRAVDNKHQAAHTVTAQEQLDAVQTLLDEIVRHLNLQKLYNADDLC